MDDISPDDILARYLLNKKDYRADKTIRHRAFIPSPKTGQTSVFRITGLKDSEIWSLGEKEVAQKRNLPILARADVKYTEIEKIDLYLELDNIPPRHANIIGWPEEKSAIRLKAMELAENSILYSKE